MVKLLFKETRMLALLKQRTVEELNSRFLRMTLGKLNVASFRFPIFVWNTLTNEDDLTNDPSH